jgi:energy-coupling factor transporter transmembrane protein EcfT
MREDYKKLLIAIGLFILVLLSPIIVPIILIILLVYRDKAKKFVRDRLDKEN